MNKTYRVAIIRNGNDENNGLEISGPDARVCLDRAMEIAEYNVARGLHIRVSCGTELVWDSAEAPVLPSNIIPVNFKAA